jgi:hypothetical protein
MSDRNEPVTRLGPDSGGRGPGEPPVRVYHWEWGPDDARRPGLPWIGIFLLVFGASGFVGNLVGGRLGDWSVIRSVVIGMAGPCLRLALLAGLLESTGDGLGGTGQRSLGLAAGAGLGHLADQVGQAGVLARPGLQVQPVARLGEAQIGVDAGHDDPDVDLQDFDADQGDPYERVDDETPVEDQFQNVVEAAGAASPAGLLCRDNGHVYRASLS